MIKIMEGLKPIAIYCLEQGDLAIQQSDHARAAKLYQKAADIGRELSAPNRLDAYRSLGDYISAEAKNRISMAAQDAGH